MKSKLCVLFFVCQVVCAAGFVTAGTLAVTAKNASGMGLAAVKNTAAAGIVTEGRTEAAPFNSISEAAGGIRADAFVTKHLFTPEDYSSGKGDGLNGKDKPLLKIFRIAKKQLVFSGIISSDRGRKALILNRRAKDPAKRRHSSILGKGDTIMDLSIEDVGPNFVILASQGQTMRMNLYQGDKKRPRPIPQPKVAVRSTNKTAKIKTGATRPKAANMIKNTKKAAGKSANRTKSAIARAKTAERAHAGFGNGSTSKTKVFTKMNNPFANAVKKGNNLNTTTKGTNPFLDAIRKAMEKK